MQRAADRRGTWYLHGVLRAAIWTLANFHSRIQRYTTYTTIKTIFIFVLHVQACKGTIMIAIAIFFTYFLVNLYLEQDIFLSVQNTERHLFIQCHCTRHIWQPTGFQPCKVFLVHSSTSAHQPKTQLSLASYCDSTILLFCRQKRRKWRSISYVAMKYSCCTQWFIKQITQGIWWEINGQLFLSTGFLQASQLNAWSAVMKPKFLNYICKPLTPPQNNLDRDINVILVNTIKKIARWSPI